MKLVLDCDLMQPFRFTSENVFKIPHFHEIR